MGWSVVAGAGRWDGRDGLKDRLATKLRAAVPDRTSGRNGGTTRPVYKIGRYRSISHSVTWVR
jgi:hypothetical protein